MAERTTPVDIPPELAARLEFGPHDGYTGDFTRQQAQGAIPNGTRIVKCGTIPGDTREDGAPGTVLGSIGHGPLMLYFVEWDSAPRTAVAVASHRIERA
jgi:hypothetical protein